MQKFARRPQLGVDVFHPSSVQNVSVLQTKLLSPLPNFLPPQSPEELTELTFFLCPCQEGKLTLPAARLQLLHRFHTHPLPASQQCHLPGERSQRISQAAELRSCSRFEFTVNLFAASGPTISGRHFIKGAWIAGNTGHAVTSSEARSFQLHQRKALISYNPLFLTTHFLQQILQ